MSDRDAMRTALEAAIQAVGGHAVVAEKLGITTQAVWQWVICPPVRVLPLEALSGMSRHLLRPDMFGRPGEACSAASHDGAVGHSLHGNSTATGFQIKEVAR